MKLLRRIEAMLAACIMCGGIILLTGCGNVSSDGTSEKRVVRIAIAQNESHPEYLALEEFKKEIEEKTNGKFDVQIFPNELLGAQTQTIELTQTGAVDISVIGLSVLESFNRAYTVFTLPYLMDSVEHYHSVMNDDSIMEPVYQATKDSGFIGLSWFDAGVRNMYTTNTPINKPEDLKGLKIRVQTSETNVKMLEALGASATPMSFGEVYTGLQQGVIDGAENNELALINNKHGEVAKYYSYTMHLMQPDIVIMSTSLLDDLTSEEQEIFKEAAKNSTNWELDAWNKAATDAKAQAEEMGVNFIYPDIKPFQEKMTDLYDKYKKDPTINKVYEEIRDKADELK